MERETGIGPATNSLEGCDSTTELLPLTFIINSLACVWPLPTECKSDPLERIGTNSPTGEIHAATLRFCADSEGPLNLLEHRLG
jgi:hypothetical protein